MAGEPQNSGVLALMQQEMLARFMKTHPLAHRLPPQLTLEQALVWFTVPPRAPLMTLRPLAFPAAVLLMAVTVGACTAPAQMPAAPPTAAAGAAGALDV